MALKIGDYNQKGCGIFVEFSGFYTFLVWERERKQSFQMFFNTSSNFLSPVS